MTYMAFVAKPLSLSSTASGLPTRLGTLTTLRSASCLAILSWGDTPIVALPKAKPSTKALLMASSKPVLSITIGAISGWAASVDLLHGPSGDLAYLWLYLR